MRCGEEGGAEGLDLLLMFAKWSRGRSVPADGRRDGRMTRVVPQQGHNGVRYKSI